MAQILDINGNWVDDGQPAEGLINSKKVEGQKYQVEVGQNEQGQSIYEEQEYSAPKPILKESYAVGEEDQYVKDLSLMTHGGTGQQAASAETGTDTWQKNSTGTEETFTPEQAIELYNNMDPRLANDPNMSSRLASAGMYYESEGDFKPGGARATAQNFKDYIVQSEIDAATQQKNLRTLGLLMVGGIAGGAVLAGGSAAAGGGAAAAGSGASASGAGAMGATTAAEAAAGSTAFANSLSPYLAAEGAAAAGGGAAAAGSGGSGGALGASNSFLSSPTGKFLASQGIGLGAKALAGDKEEKPNNGGLINSNNQQKPQSQPTIIYNYGSQQPQPKAPKPIASANAGMYGSGSGWGNSISTYQKKKGG